MQFTHTCFRSQFDNDFQASCLRVFPGTYNSAGLLRADIKTSFVVLVASDRAGAVSRPAGFLQLPPEKSAMTSTLTQSTESRPEAEFQTAANSPSLPKNDCPTKDIADVIMEAFQFVAMYYCCTLPALLAETRRRGLQDDDVKESLLQTERQMENDERIRAARTESGVAYLWRDVGVDGFVASVNELFRELQEADCE